ncbi:Intron-binding protein aquarius [Liparis tanakae]|uniref:Intron-binding protein aquarius n=1 Tax=Liparis tanakae TaxID=230148 RepID=A0A4Z2FD25_9TELE|nr:Intron-binding protein aquarius [Liparis tanakae]
MSRARLGLYVFGRVSLFQNCFELTPVFSQLTARVMQLHIRPHEYYSQEQPRDASGQPDQIIKNMPEMTNMVYNMYMHMIQTSQKYRQQQQQKLALPPQQTTADAAMEEGDLQEPSPKEQEPSPKEQEPSPKEQEPSPKEQEPSPKEQEPSPKDQEPTPMEQEPTPIEQEPPAGGSDPEGSSGALGHAKMPEHPGRDSDDDDEEVESGAEPKP